MVIIVAGLPGSGKSYFAVRLAEKLNAEYISSDGVRKEMFKQRTYSSGEKLNVYDEMILRMKAALDLNKHVILDATFFKEALRKKFLLALPAGIKIYFIEVVTTESLIRTRLQQPRPDSEADLSVYELIRNEWQPLPEQHLTLQSTNDNIEAMLQQALLFIQYPSNQE